mmetsp:Transcript_2556/g.6554  ORF Transcript_2556/g.6554 Transcript_2556/m.6554 type:complete len:220 (+) Transcript_2556:237-896(+)
MRVSSATQPLPSVGLLAGHVVRQHLHHGRARQQRVARHQVPLLAAQPPHSGGAEPGHQQHHLQQQQRVHQGGGGVLRDARRARAVQVEAVAPLQRARGHRHGVQAARGAREGGVVARLPHAVIVRAHAPRAVHAAAGAHGQGRAAAVHQQQATARKRVRQRQVAQGGQRGVVRLLPLHRAGGWVQRVQPRLCVPPLGLGPPLAQADFTALILHCCPLLT